MARLNSLARWFSSMSRRLPLRGRHFAHIVMVVGAIVLICCFPPPGLVAHWKLNALRSVEADASVDWGEVPVWYNDVFRSLPDSIRDSVNGFCKFVFFDRLKAVRLHGPEFGDEQLHMLRGCEGLEWLDVSASMVTTTGLGRVLRDSGRDIRFLNIAGSQVDRGIVPALNDLPALDGLNAAGTGIGIGELALRPQGVRYLELGPCNISSEEIQTIGSLPLLELTLHGCRLDDEQIAGLADTPFARSCRTLGIIDSEISTGGILALRGIGPLANLSLRGSQFDGGEFEQLMLIRGMSLQELDVSNTRLNMETYHSLRHAKRLFKLNLAGTPLSDMDCATVLANMTVRRSHTWLMELDLSGTQAGDLTARCLATCNSDLLFRLDLSRTRISGRGVIELVNARKKRAISTGGLWLRDTDVTDAVVDAFDGSEPFRLDVRGTRISERGRNALRDSGHELIAE